MLNKESESQRDRETDEDTHTETLGAHFAQSLGVLWPCMGLLSSSSLLTPRRGPEAPLMRRMRGDGLTDADGET